MKGIFTLLVLLLLFAACSTKQEDKPTILQNQSPLVIQFVSGILIPQTDSLITNQNFSLAQQLFVPFNIPVLTANSETLIFVKKNGDKVTVSLGNLEMKYDIILFDGVSDPVTLKISDLKNACYRLFGNPVIKKTLHHKYKKTTKNFSIQNQDTTVHKGANSLISELVRRNKKIVVSLADTSTTKLNTKSIPGIEWVEHRIDTRRMLKIQFENDLITYSNTDRYFTNGITFDLQAAWLSYSRLANLIIPYHHKAFVTYNLTMVQDMYTPTDTRIAPTLQDDRPYASYLYFGFRETIADPLRKLKIFSEFDAGYLGPYSPGSYMQTLVHKVFPTNDKPLGWETQIKTDVILNYEYMIQKEIIARENFIFLAGLNAKAGTLYDQAGFGIQIQAGKADPYFGLAVKEQWPKLEYYLFTKSNFTFVAYNALLQGGMLNRTTVFTLKGSEIQRFVGIAEAGIHFRYRGIGVELAQHYLSPEYKSGLWHKWGRMSLLFKL